MTTLIHERTQNAVGQGFFHNGRVEISDAAFVYVYDCGSTSGSSNTSQLATEIRLFADRTSQKIDVLFLSHFDRDHVNGTDRLLSLIRAETIVIPYLTEYERVLLAAKALDDDDLTADYVHFLCNPVDWFGIRGADRVIFITGEDHNQQPSIDDVNPLSPDDDPDRNPIYKRRLPDDTPQLQIDKDILNEHATKTVEIRDLELLMLPDFYPLLITRYGSQVNWCFLTFVHPEKELREEFAKSLRQRMNAPFDEIPDFGLPPADISDWLRNTLQNRSERDKLAKLYREGFKDRNLTSLSLYSGPIKRNNGDYEVNPKQLSSIRGNPPIRKTEIGWLGTGDSNLNDPDRRNEFLRHYKPVWSHIATFCLPHHGSRLNFDESIVPDSTGLCVVGVSKRNRYGHPHPEVEEALKRRNLPLKKVTEATSSRLTERFELVRKRI